MRMVTYTCNPSIQEVEAERLTKDSYVTLSIKLLKYF